MRKATYKTLGMKYQPLISVSMPAFNAEKYLALSIKSILSQTYSNFELIIYDDGSSDKTREIILKFSDPRVKAIFSDVNEGLIFARNAIARNAKGKYLALMDADDIAEPDRFEKQVTALESGQCDLCGTAYWTFNESTGVRKNSKQRYSSADLRALLTVASPFCNPTIMGKLKIFQEIPYLQENKHAEDYGFLVEASLRGYKFKNLSKKLLTYRLHGSQVSMVHNEEARKVFLKVQKQYLNGMKIGPEFCPRSMNFYDRTRYAIPFMRMLSMQIRGISFLANNEIYARYQFRGNGILTPFTRIERWIISAWASINGWLY